MFHSGTGGEIVVIWQACAAWQWYNYAESQVPSGKLPLRINLDETSICLFQGDVKGTVFVSRKRKRRFFEDVPEQPDRIPEPVQRVGRKQRRTCLTHVGIVCDNPAVQPRLPQIIIGNCATFLLRDWARLNAVCPANVVLIRQQSAWNNAGLLKRIVALLHAALLPFYDRYQPILLMGACRVHLKESLAHWRAARMLWLVIVPAKLTWLLQPCDTHCFQRCKAYLKAAYQRLRIANDTGEVSTVEFISAVCGAIRYVLQARRWAAAFEQDGYGSSQAAVSAYVLRQLEVQAAPQVGAARPSLDVLQRCYPAGARVPMAWLMRPMEPAVQAALPGPAAPKAPALALAQQPALPGAAGGGPLALPVGRPLAPRRLIPLPRPAGPLTRSQSRLAAALTRPALPRTGATGSSASCCSADRGIVGDLA